MKHQKTIDMIAVILLLVGGICWGLLGAFNFEPISMILGSGDMMSPLVRIVYVLIGLSGLYRIYTWAKAHK